MTQFIITTSDGRAFGVVLDDRPMSEAEVIRHRSHFGARTLADVVAYADYVAGDRNRATIARLAGRPKRFARSGQRPRRYPASAECVVVECAA